ncbi:MAG: D-tyrosyl-tRNA(Tyr) deacylase [Myxococcota bacterium]|jgi:D-tyrosyl-tRNA(Tyr) deacylase
MRAVIQRVQHASVQVDSQETGSCGKGLLILLGVAPEDTDSQVTWLVDKISGLRIFADDAGKMNDSMLDQGLSALVVSQFTLYGDTRRGRRPGFSKAAPPAIAEPLYERFCEALAAKGVPVGRGVFGADMAVSLVNDGPVTLILDTP